MRRKHGMTMLKVNDDCCNSTRCEKKGGLYPKDTKKFKEKWYKIYNRQPIISFKNRHRMLKFW